MDHVAGLATQVADRIGRIRAVVDELHRRSPSTEVRVSSAGGEVVVSVDRHGRLMSLQLASGSTARFTCEALECLINDTLRVAVDLAVRPDRQLVSAQDDPAGQLEAIRTFWKNPDHRITATRLMIEASPGVDESSAVEELLAAHAEMERLTTALADARERRRAAARRLIELGRGFPWIAARLGVTPQAVDGFVKYKDRNQRT